VTHKITDPYTAEYAITPSGKLLPTVFICLQKRSGTFSPWICEEARKFGNVFVTATKLRKEQKETYEHFLDNVKEPYVKK
jgi:hypothetical protein